MAACEGCRKQKIRCDMADPQGPCTRCRKKRLQCSVKPDFESYIMDDLLWKHGIEQKLKDLETRSSATGNSSEEAATLQTGTTPVAPDHGGRPHNAHSRLRCRSNFTLDLTSSPGSLPSITFQALTEPRMGNPPPDIISDGVITIDNARKYHVLYRDRLDHFLYGVLGDRSKDSFEQLQQKSAILSTAICAVGALHAPSDDYEKLHLEFVKLVAAVSFTTSHTPDDVRGLCIAAFWISDLSTSLSSLAVRIAIELQLQRSFKRAVQGDYQHYLKARLYYLVYACDHHLSIPHGRPPLTRECEAVKSIRQFLDCKFSTHDDVRLASQISRWSIWSEIHDDFAQDMETPLTTRQTLAVRRFCIKLDTLRSEWAEKMGFDEYVGNYPWKGAAVQSYFVKLYLCSHAFRGLHPRSNATNIDLFEIASSAVLAATCILRTVNEDQEVQSYLNGLPTYHHVMVAFAIVFLLKASTQFASFLRVNMEDTRILLTQSISVLRGITKEMHQQHLLVTITESAADAVARSFQTSLSLTGYDSSTAGVVQEESSINDPLDEFFSTYDFLADHVV